VPRTSADGSRATRKAWAILAAMGFGALIAQMFSTVIGPALPTVREDLGLSLSEQTWTITAYSLAFGTALVAGGRLGDLVGEVKMIVAGFAIFGLGLVAAAVATSGGMLITGRAIQGVGIGISAPATLSIVVNSFPVIQRGFAVGVWGFAHGFGLLIGPLFAALMLDIASWRWVFWVALPLTVLVIVVTVLATRGYRSVLASGSYDWLGLVVGGSGITLVTYGLQNSANGWAAPGTWATLIGGVVLLLGFAGVEMRREHPLVDFALWRERLFTGGFVAESAVGFIYIPMLTFIGSLFFITVLGYSPATASWVIVITTGTCMLFEPPAGKWVDKIGPGIPITVALGLQAVALFWMSTFGPDTTLAQMVVPLALMGMGVGISLPACNTAGMSAVDAERAGMGSGLMQMTFNIPAALGVAVVTSIVGTVTAATVDDAFSDPGSRSVAQDYVAAVQGGDPEAADKILGSVPPDVAEAIRQAAVAAESTGITTAMVALAVVALAGAVFAWIVIGRRRVPGIA
jgi:EmrB/QacA subfamily drug resistance transporter